jgi:hypothetical protein
VLTDGDAATDAAADGATDAVDGAWVGAPDEQAAMISTIVTGTAIARSLLGIDDTAELLNLEIRQKRTVGTCRDRDDHLLDVMGFVTGMRGYLSAPDKFARSTWRWNTM